MFSNNNIYKCFLCALLITALQTSSLAQLPDYIPSNGLVGWWPFTGGAEDVSSLQLGGNSVNASLTTDRFGNSHSAYYFNGSNAHIEVPHNMLLNSLPLTISLWFKPDTVNGGGSLISKYMNASWSGWNVGIGGPSDSVEFLAGHYLVGGNCNGIIDGYGCGSGLTYYGELYDNQWHLSTFVVDSIRATFFLDGQEVSSQDWAVAPHSVYTPYNMLIGAYRMNTQPWNYYKGKLDDLGVWNRALSQEEIAGIYQNAICAPIGHVYNDFNQNCTNLGVGVSNVLMEINPGGILTISDNLGDFYLCDTELSDGVYTASINAESMGWQSACSNSYEFTITNGIITDISEFGIYNEGSCANPSVTIIASTIRRCSEHTWPINLQVCNSNSATGILDSSFVNVVFDEGIIIESADVPFQQLQGNTYEFFTGDVLPGQCIDVTINANFSCDLELDETVCMEATLYPVPECLQDTVPVPGPCELPWDHSSLEVEGECDEDTGTITFTIENDGEAMVCSSEVRVYVDGELFETHYIQLGAESDTMFTYPTNGGTWILQADQHPLHPGNSHPNDHVEGCGDIEGEGDGDDDDDDGDDDDDDEWEPGLVDDLPCGDESPFVDEFCGQVVGSFDPNDKQGFPNGVGETHDVLPNEQLQYLIRFQNTGTAPAYTVVIRDTLDTDLDIFSVTPGVASHDYSFTMYGERVLQWTFNNIMLADSFSNEEASHGFITYTVNQVADLTDGTAITNSAAIYFDSNEPVITNTTLHTINYCLFKDTHSTMDATSCGSYIAPDGQTYDQSGTYTAVLVNAAGCDSTITIHLQSIDLNPQVEGNGSGTLTASPSGLTYQWINCDTNTPVDGATSATFTGGSGNYAVQVSDGACMEQSECAQLVGLSELTSPHLRVYPVPASQQITVAWTGNATGYTITLPDGRVLASGRFASGVNVIDISTLATGNYFLKADNRVTRFVVK
jgi:uncharacterized repeat protein (TIGR01451 family)